MRDYKKLYIDGVESVMSKKAVVGKAVAAAGKAVGKAVGKGTAKATAKATGKAVAKAATPPSGALAQFGEGVFQAGGDTGRLIARIAHKITGKAIPKAYAAPSMAERVARTQASTLAGDAGRVTAFAALPTAVGLNTAYNVGAGSDGTTVNEALRAKEQWRKYRSELDRIY